MLHMMSSWSHHDCLGKVLFLTLYSYSVHTHAHTNTTQRLHKNRSMKMQLMVSNSQHTPPLSLSHKKAQVVSLCYRHSNQSSNEPSPDNFMTIGGCFKRCTYRVMALGWLKKEVEEEEEEEEERRIWTILTGFQPFQVCHFKIVTTCCYYYCRLGQTLYAALCTFRHEHLFFGDDITM